jgi:hypothetical protein
MTKSTALARMPGKTGRFKAWKYGGFMRKLPLLPETPLD